MGHAVCELEPTSHTGQGTANAVGAWLAGGLAKGQLQPAVVYLPVQLCPASVNHVHTLPVCMLLHTICKHAGHAAMLLKATALQHHYDNTCSNAPFAGLLVDAAAGQTAACATA